MHDHLSDWRTQITSMSPLSLHRISKKVFLCISDISIICGEKGHMRVSCFWWFRCPSHLGPLKQLKNTLVIAVQPSLSTIIPPPLDVSHTFTTCLFVCETRCSNLMHSHQWAQFFCINIIRGEEAHTPFSWVWCIHCPFHPLAKNHITWFLWCNMPMRSRFLISSMPEQKAPQILHKIFQIF